MGRTLVWFRRDLRLADNPALIEACSRGQVLPLFVLDPRLLGRAPARERWLLGALGALDAALRGAGAALILRRGAPHEEIPRLVGEMGADVVSWNRDWTPFARRRDAAVHAACRTAGAEVRTFPGDALVEPCSPKPAAPM